jgi:hypothetical protein
VNGFYSNGTVEVGANTVTLADANDAAFDSGALVTLGSGGSPGTLASANGLTLDFSGNIIGFGTVSTPNNVVRRLINNGHVTGNSGAQPITLTGYVKGVGTFDNVSFTGTYDPGLSPTLTTVGSILFGATNTLIMELGGTTRGDEFDAIIASGNLGMGGTLQVTPIGGFTPSLGNAFDLFDWATISGTFAALNLPALAAGLTWDTSQLYTTGVLSVVPAGVAGDYNDDGIVDTADFVVWQKFNGTSTQLPNDPNPVPIDTDQYNTWRTNFGSAEAGSGAGGVAFVPEPGAMYCAIFAMLTAISVRWLPR